MRVGFLGIATLWLLVAACSAPVPREATKGHLSSAGPGPVSGIPSPVRQALLPPKPRPSAKTETFSVVVANGDVRDLLFYLAREAKVNIDIYPGISGTVTLNAIDQPLKQILSRIARQVDMRFELEGRNLSVMPDLPFLKHYKVDYVSMSRNVTGTVSANTQIATGPANGASGGPGNSSGNLSNTRIENGSKNLFWESLEKNIKDILRETDKVLPEGSSETVVEQAASQSATGAAALPAVTGRTAATMANVLTTAPGVASSSQASGNTVVRRTTFREAASVITNPESGILTVRATQRQHEKIQEFIDRVVNAAQRQVMIEATIVEVLLSDGYEQGIDWTRLIGAGTFKLINRLGTTTNMTFAGNTVRDTAISLLETFGTTKVLSSPRLSVLNNQTALLKVVESYVYFNVKAELAGATTISQPIKAYTTTPQTVSVGLVMTVTPQVSDNDVVILNIRPTITSIGGEVQDPNPDLVGIPNRVPRIRTREIESVMRVASGEIAVLGGLMEDGIDYRTSRVPVLGQLPVAGEVFNNRANSARKSELVIFLRPVVVKDASLAGDYAGLRALLPDDRFFAQPPEAQPFNISPRP